MQQMQNRTVAALGLGVPAPSAAPAVQ